MILAMEVKHKNVHTIYARSRASHECVDADLSITFSQDGFGGRTVQGRVTTTRPSIWRNIITEGGSAGHQGSQPKELPQLARRKGCYTGCSIGASAGKLKHTVQ